MILGAGATRAAFPNGDKNGLKIPLMNDLMETIPLQDLLKDYPIDYKGINFEEIFSELYEKYGNRELMDEIDNRVYTYFSQMELPAEATFYDKLILSLRKKDLIASFNWDPLLPMAFRRNNHIKELPDMIFLHGNVFIGSCIEHRKLGYIDDVCGDCKRPLKRTKLLYPISNKKYDKDPVIKNEWEKLKRLLAWSYWLTIFGYSAPKTDIVARKTMLERWNANPTKELAQIEIIDIDDEKKLEASWNDFFVRNHYGIKVSFDMSYLMIYPRRSCEALAFATLQTRPWQQKPFPATSNLTELQEWVSKYIEDEPQYNEQDIK